MRQVEVLKDFTRNKVEYKKGHRYVMAEDSENQLRSVDGEKLGMSFPITDMYNKYTGQDLNGKTILAWRTGGIGDMFFLSPVLRHLKTMYPKCSVIFASGAKGPLENIPEIDELHDMPFDAELMKKADYHLMFQGIIEGQSEESKRTHAADMFFSYFSIDSTHLEDDVKRPAVFFTEKELEWQKEEFSKYKVQSDDYVIGIQMETSAPLRNFPKEKLKTVIDILAKEPKVKIFLIGTEQQKSLANFYRGGNKNIFLAVNYDIRQSIVLAKRYNLVISPDTFMVQAAGALEVPLIGLYGPFPSEVRMKYFKNAIGIEPQVACTPCYKHDFRACIKGYPSPCYTQITPEIVLNAVNYQKQKFTGKPFNYMAPLLMTPDLSEVEKYMMSADQGISFFAGYYKPVNSYRVDSNQFVEADTVDLSQEFKRGYYPFVLYMNDFSQKSLSVYHNAKNMVRPGGFFIIYKRDGQEQAFIDIKKDIGQSFILMHSKFEPTTGAITIVGKKQY